MRKEFDINYNPATTAELVSMLNAVLSNEETDTSYIYSKVREIAERENPNGIPIDIEIRLWLFKIWSSFKNFVRLIDSLGFQLTVSLKDEEN